jgi:DNA-binding MarR family transcriptional regulator/GNAT superfamily N-acetyltransferase
MQDRDEPKLRVANRSDSAAIEALMKASVRGLFPRDYDARQTASGEQYIAQVDRMMVDDGTFFVLESGGALVACGGWSRRDRIYTGSGDAEGDARELDPATEPARVRAMFVHPDWTRRGLGRRILDACELAAAAAGFGRLTLVSTLPGLPLYRACGFEALEDVDVETPDGVILPAVRMEKPIRAGPTAAEIAEAARVRAALRLFLRSCEVITRRHGLSPRQYELLLMIRAAPGGRSTVSELVPLLQLTQSTVTELVQRAEERGFLRRRPSAADGRVVHLSLTAEGGRRVAGAIVELGPERANLLETLERARGQSSRAGSGDSAPGSTR